MFDWSPQKARELYSLPHWSAGYFDVSESGTLVARPRGQDSPAVIELAALSRRLQDEGLTLPVLVRFLDVLRHRAMRLAEVFAAARSAENYRGGYTAVYPIKVNQQKGVVETILSAGDHVGLEAGSKPELLAVLALSRAGGVVVCNGYKDREYIRLALIGCAMGLRVHIVVEKPSEMALVLSQAADMGIEPLVGLRVRLSAIGAGKWQNTGGDKAKFGLSAAQVLECVAQLRDAGKLDWLRMIHFHMGSQIANIQDIQRGMKEASRWFAELRLLGAPVDTVNVGGGLAVDYEGTRSRSFCSMNYSLEEYALNIVRALREVCAEHGFPEPGIVTESGRAMTAHHAVLVTNVVGTELAAGSDRVPGAKPDEPQVVRDLARTLADFEERSVLEAFHDAGYHLQEANTLFAHGVINLGERARAEQIHAALLKRVRDCLDPRQRSHREMLDEVNERLADKYFCNFSLFQSIPDSWAIDQIFPVVPLERLGEPPTRRTTLGDITCDSDGRIDHYVARDGVDATLPLHALRPDERYLLGIFLVGAYQEILGDMHNLFGDTDSADVELDGNGGYRVVRAARGDTVGAVLRYVHFDSEDLLVSYRQRLHALDRHAEARRAAWLEELIEGLGGYTYLED